MSEDGSIPAMSRLPRRSTQSEDWPFWSHEVPARLNIYLVKWRLWRLFKKYSTGDPKNWGAANLIGAP
jgi:hypothetical protein